jgi:hypothetical protein
MTRPISTLVAAAVAMAVVLPAMASAQASKTMSAKGTVSAVSAASLTVKGGATETWTFVIDKETSVTAKGATHKSLALSAESKTGTLPDFVKVGDTVSVGYHDMGTMKHAASITVTAPGAPK